MLYTFKIYDQYNTMIFRKDKTYATFNNALKYGKAWALKTYCKQGFSHDNNDFKIVAPWIIPTECTFKEAF